MDLKSAKHILTRTHFSAVQRGVRAHGFHMQSMPGIGKSDGVMQYAGELCVALQQPVGIVTQMLATIASVDVRGFMLPVKNSETGKMDTLFSTPPWYPVRANTMVIEPCPVSEHNTLGYVVHPEGTWPNEYPMPGTGVVFLDEFSQAEDDVKKPAAELVYKGSVGTTHLPPGWRVVSAGNRMSDRSGVLRELMFIVNRRCLLNVDSSLSAWLEFVNTLKPMDRPHYLTISFAQKNPDLVFMDKVPDGTDPFCTPRTLCMMDQDIRAMADDATLASGKLPLDDETREMCAGWIGEGTAAQFFAHLKYADELPEIDAIVKNPNAAKLPAARDAQMVCAYMLAHNINAGNASPMLDYMNRLNPEMQFLMVRAVNAQRARAATIVTNPKFTQWLSANQKVLMASRS